MLIRSNIAELVTYDELCSRMNRAVTRLRMLRVVNSSLKLTRPAFTCITWLVVGLLFVHRYFPLPPYLGTLDQLVIYPRF